MQYKTIVLELLAQNPKLYEELRQSRRLLSAMDLLADQLKASHEAVAQALMEQTPQADQRAQIRSQAMEMAVRELEERLQSGTSDEAEHLEAAMAFVLHHTSNG